MRSLTSSHKRDRLAFGRSIWGINLSFSNKLTRPNASPLHRECDRPLFLCALCISAVYQNAIPGKKCW
ncbi:MULTISPECIES: hypothetical protein [Cyanophyceae]|uniref:hypothetical protein n=1 Tax=Cyanophyceae TaxID=3028117 RepID=UPI001688AEF5|nr:hypothetical protein [Trichocoleus sp. FACHB-40]MBD2003110.1 hypothetical protein [Trichocoleus sp. FACHB-40]